MAFKQSDAELLFKHLQAVIDVELFTIPLYLTAVNSTRTSLPDGDPAYTLQTLANSVAVQEMYHLQQACNLANAFNVTPVISRLTLKAGEKILVPHLDPNDQAFYAQLGNLPHAINEMVQVETPDESGQPVTPNDKVQYRSISDLYEATLLLLSAYIRQYERTPAALDPHFFPGNKQIAYGAFPTRFNYNKILLRTDVINSINAITDQGEGNTVKPQPASPFLRGSAIDGKVLPPYQGTKNDRFYAQDLWSHFYRFNQIVDGLKTVPLTSFYNASGTPSPDLPSWAPPLDVLQEAVSTIWSFLLDVLQAGVASGNLQENNVQQPQYPGFNSAMVSFKYTLGMVWQYGVCPSFLYKAGTSAQDVQNAMDAVDPWCLFHWDAATTQFRLQHPDQLNACQGLNDCSGRGWGALSTQPGDGACATADTHTCTGSNACTHQGACGYFSSDAKGNLLPPSEQWIPGQNTGEDTGGCQTPISTKQVFHNYPDSDFPAGWESLKALRTTKVWDEARNLVAQKLGIDPSQLPTPKTGQSGKVNYDGTQRRDNTTPSST